MTGVFEEVIPRLGYLLMALQFEWKRKIRRFGRHACHLLPPCHLLSNRSLGDRNAREHSLPPMAFHPLGWGRLVTESPRR